MDVRKKVYEIMADELNIAADKITDASTFDDLGFDSLDLAELVFEIEQAFGVELDENEIAGMKSVGALVSHVTAKAKG